MPVVRVGLIVRQLGHMGIATLLILLWLMLLMLSTAIGRRTRGLAGLVALEALLCSSMLTLVSKAPSRLTIILGSFMLNLND